MVYGMKLHRFIGDFDLNKDIIEIEDAELANQIRNVLRLKIGEKIVLSNGQKEEVEATIIESNKKYIEVSVGKVTKPAREPKKSVTLFSAILKRENFELVVQKATELGATKIVPLMTERTVKTGFNRERLEKIIKEASEQSGRTTVPEIAEPTKFVEAIDEVNPKESVLFDLSGSPLTSNLSPLSCIFIGPEGGFTDQEVKIAKDAGIKIGSLGDLTLRGETAAIIATHIAINS